MTKFLLKIMLEFLKDLRYYTKYNDLYNVELNTLKQLRDTLSKALDEVNDIYNTRASAELDKE